MGWMTVTDWMRCTNMYLCMYVCATTCVSVAGQDPPPLEEVDGLFSLEDAAPGHPGHQDPGRGPHGHREAHRAALLQVPEGPHRAAGALQEVRSAVGPAVCMHLFIVTFFLPVCVCVCRFPCMRRFAYDIYYYRAAVRIQRLM